MIITLDDTTANNALTQILTRLQAGSAVAAAYVEFYTGTKPAKPDVAVGAQVKLGTCTCTPSVGSVAARALTFGAITQDSAADATGTATWCRFKNRDNVAIVDGDVTNTSGTGFAKMNTTSIVVDGPILVSSCVITL